MPPGLRVATFLCSVFGILAPVSLLPFGTHRIDGVTVGFAEFWQRGGGPVFFALGIGCALLAYGFLRARRWSRPLFVLAVLSLTLPAVCMSLPAAETRLLFQLFSAAWHSGTFFTVVQSESIFREAMRTPPNQAMQLTASKPAIYASSVCRQCGMLRSMHGGLAAADLVSR
jgi:peptidoglycan/LPS O-acetylase OafA/YrhL